MLEGPENRQSACEKLVDNRSMEAAGDFGVVETDGSEMGATSPAESRLLRMLRIEWLGQTLASLCWIASVLAYGISSVGDWLQMAAASCWLVANIATVVAKVE